ncbi:hypothetical protein OUI_0576 [Helicobacter pylori R036d]|uniref:Uncharacterized protein n=1 Tax=Helicobacter pylori R036d TaxID=1145113 RepID=K2KXC4_HELPX|nr:hypothetical protein OUI_0576 [Helicobacter pylori R036d]
MPSSSPCIEFNSVSPTDLKMGLMESNFLKRLRCGLMRENKRVNERGNNKK